jgi:colanic acid biosynthesis glycosyl transferase WcaI
MNILVVSQYYWPETFRINDMVAGLTQREHQVTVLTGIPNYPDGVVYPAFAIDPASYSDHDGVKVVRVPMFLRGKGAIQLVLNYLSFAISASLIGSYKLRKQQFDIIFCCQLSPVTIGIPAIIFRKLRSIPLVLWVLDLWPDSLHAVGAIRSRLFLSVIGKLVTYIYNHSDLILGQSRSFLPHIMKNSRNIRIEYFPSWAESLFQQEQTELFSPEKRRNQFNILFAGNVGEAQDFPAVLKAVEILKESSSVHWTILGDGRMLKWIENEVYNRNLQSSVTLAGRHPIENIPKFFQQADALLVSLKDEPIFSMTIPGKLQAYLTSGKPILAMLNGEGAKVVTESACGIACNAGNGEGLAKSVIKLKKMSKEEQKLMGERGRELSHKEFDRGALISRLEQWMKELVMKNEASF